MPEENIPEQEQRQTFTEWAGRLMQAEYAYRRSKGYDPEDSVRCALNTMAHLAAELGIEVGKCPPSRSAPS